MYSKIQRETWATQTPVADRVFGNPVLTSLGLTESGFPRIDRLRGNADVRVLTDEPADHNKTLLHLLTHLNGINSDF
jgi:hypothetical protein